MSQPAAIDAVAVAADLRRLRLASCPKLLFVTHGRGGGTDRHVSELTATVGKRAIVLVLHPTPEQDHCLAWRHEPTDFRLHFRLPEEQGPLRAILRAVGIARVHLHHTLGLDRGLLRLPADLGVPYDFTVHDFYTICPRVHLFDPVQLRYCGEPDENGCNRCLRHEPRTPASAIHAWREQHRPLIEGAARVFVPSADAAARIRRHFSAARITVASHPDAEREGPYPEPLTRPVAVGEPFRIVVLGALNPEKGSTVLVACAEDAAHRRLPLEFHLLGSVYPKPVRDPGKKLICHGPYRDEDLDRRLAALQPHLAWFPAQWPETYSYTLSAALRNGLPIAATDLGAFAERLAGRSGSSVRPWQTAPSAWNDLFLSLREGTPRESPSDLTRAPGGPCTYQDHYLDPIRSRLATGSDRCLVAAYLGPFARPAGGAVQALAHQMRGIFRDVLRKVYYSPLCYPLAARIPLRYRQWLGRKLGRAG